MYYYRLGKKGFQKDFFFLSGPTTKKITLLHDYYFMRKKNEKDKSKTAFSLSF